jgi:predicted amino acid racemase
LVLEIFYLREEGLQRGQLLIGPAHTQEVDVVTTLTVILITLLKLYGERERDRAREREWK